MFSMTTGAFVIIFIHLAALLVFHTVHGKLFIFKHSTNYEEANNWNNGRAPCPQDEVSLPRSSAMIGIGENVNSGNLNLPYNGELIFNRDASIFIESQNVLSLGCPNEPENIVYNYTEPKYWFETRNWKTSENADVRMDALPIDRIPSQEDKVYFPEGKSYYVDISTNKDNTRVGSQQIRIQAFTIGGKYFNQDQLNAFWHSSEGKKQFVNSHNELERPVIRLEAETSECGEENSCVPYTSDPRVMAMICSMEKCKTTHCDEKISKEKIVGACCDMCGFLFAISTTQHNKQKIARIVTEILYETAKELKIKRRISASLIVSNNKQIQLFVDEGSETHKEIRNTIARKLEKSSNQGYTYTEVASSKIENHRSQYFNPSIGATLGIIALMSALVIAGLLCVKFKVIHTMRLRFFSFQSNTDNSLTVAYQSRAAELQMMAFENPTYQTSDIS